jgi:ankyrin repeat protein
MTRITVILAAVLSLAFTPLAAQGNCFDADAWKDATVIDVALCLVVTDVNARDEDGYTPLHRAARWTENPEVIIALLDAGADVNARHETGATPLHWAAFWKENPEVLILLLDAGADGTAVNDDGETPFDRAKDNEALAGTDAYWALSDARFE